MVFFPRLLLLRNTAWTSNLDQKVGCHQGYKYLKSRGAADKNTSAMAILAYNCKCQLSTVGAYYRHTEYFQYNQLSSLGALSSQCMQSKRKKIIQKISGVARGVHVGSFAPNLCTCVPILCMCSFVAYLHVALPIACFTTLSQLVM